MASGGSRQQPAAKSAKKDPKNIFINDGSFLEMFKQAQKQGALPCPVVPAASTSEKEDQPAKEAPRVTNATGGDADEKKRAAEIPKPKYGFVGKRRGGKILPTGKVKKAKQDDEEEDNVKKDAWSQYLSEVKKFKNQTCAEEGATRPLMK